MGFLLRTCFRQTKRKPRHFNPRTRDPNSSSGERRPLRAGGRAAGGMATPGGAAARDVSASPGSKDVEAGSGESKVAALDARVAALLEKPAISQYRDQLATNQPAAAGGGASPGGEPAGGAAAAPPPPASSPGSPGVQPAV